MRRCPQQPVPFANGVPLAQILDAVAPICVTAFDHRILATNAAYRSAFGDPPAGGLCHQSRPGPSCHTERCPLEHIAAGEAEFTCEARKEGEDRTFIVTARPLRGPGGDATGVIESFQDITARKAAEDRNRSLVADLERALAEVQTLRGLLPICAACKKIRDDAGNWNEVETYVEARSQAEFTHSMCPNCLREYYPDHYRGR